MKQRDLGKEVPWGKKEEGESRALMKIVGVLEARGRVVFSGKTCAGVR